MNTEKIAELGELVRNNLREVPDFPQEGILFRDMSPLLGNGKAFKQLITGIADIYRGEIDMVAGLESRGFLLATPVAAELEIGMLMIRKSGKLPGPVLGVDYALEYGTARLEIQPHAVKDGMRVLILDDVLATGGTALAAKQLIEASGAKVKSMCVLMELSALNGKEKIKDIDFQALTVV